MGKCPSKANSVKKVPEAQSNLSPLVFSVPSSPAEITSSHSTRGCEKVDQAVTQPVCAKPLELPRTLHYEGEVEKRTVKDAESEQQVVDSACQEPKGSEASMRDDMIIVESAGKAQAASQSINLNHATPQFPTSNHAAPQLPVAVPHERPQLEQHTGSVQPPITPAWHMNPDEKSRMEYLGGFYTTRPVDHIAGYQSAGEYVPQAGLSLDYRDTPFDAGHNSSGGSARTQLSSRRRHMEHDQTAALPDPTYSSTSATHAPSISAPNARAASRDPAPVPEFVGTDYAPPHLMGDHHVDISSYAGISVVGVDLFSLSTPTSSRSSSPAASQRLPLADDSDWR